MSSGLDVDLHTFSLLYRTRTEAHKYIGILSLCHLLFVHLIIFHLHRRANRLVPFRQAKYIDRFGRRCPDC
jgi:hypothetical protein